MSASWRLALPAGKRLPPIELECWRIENHQPPIEFLVDFKLDNRADQVSHYLFIFKISDLNLCSSSFLIETVTWGLPSLATSLLGPRSSSKTFGRLDIYVSPMVQL